MLAAIAPEGSLKSCVLDENYRSAYLLGASSGCSYKLKYAALFVLLLLAINRLQRAKRLKTARP